MWKARWKVGEYGSTIALVRRGNKWYMRIWNAYKQQPRYFATRESDFERAQQVALEVGPRLMEDMNPYWNGDLADNAQTIAEMQEVIKPLAGRQLQSVYFIQSEVNGLVKIGLALNVKARLYDLRAMSPVPLRLVGYVLKGGPRLERALHERFAAHRAHGEWFHLNDDLVAMIQEAAGPAAEDLLLDFPLTAGQRARPQ